MNTLFDTEKNSNLLLGLESADDAAVYKINDETAIIQTVDFFTPIVDDPFDYGAIAAANSVSDVYAMGGEVITALNICAFPADLPEEIIDDILSGGIKVIHEAGGVLAGGHTINDKEPKYGLSVTGLVHPEKFFRKSGAKPGDILVLTKPLGTGIITTANKRRMCEPLHLSDAVAVMKKLNKQAAELFRQCGVTACTDVSGFGILGHSYEIAEKSGVRLEIEYSRLPFLAGAKTYADKLIFPGGSRNNLDYYSCYSEFNSDRTETDHMLAATPETSGGLLGTVPESNIDHCRRLFSDADENLFIIGKVSDSGEPHIKIR